MLLSEAKTVSQRAPALRDYVETIAFFLIVIAVVRLRNWATPRDRALNSISCFFGFWIVLVVLKRYGLLVNPVGGLPVLNLIEFAKYPGAELSIRARCYARSGWKDLFEERCLFGEYGRRLGFACWSG